MNAVDGVHARVLLGSAALDPDSAIAAAPVADEAPVEVESVAGVVAIERVAEIERIHGITAAVEVETPAPHRRWRWFICYALLKLAAKIYPFRIEFYRTKHPWE
jgi:hypothetical protein